MDERDAKKHSNISNAINSQSCKTETSETKIDHQTGTPYIIFIDYLSIPRSFAPLFFKIRKMTFNITRYDFLTTD